MNEAINPEYKSFMRNALTPGWGELVPASTTEEGIEAKNAGCRAFLILWGACEEELGRVILQSNLHLMNFGIHVIFTFCNPQAFQKSLFWGTGLVSACCPVLGDSCAFWVRMWYKGATTWRWIFQEWGRQLSTQLFLSQSRGCPPSEDLEASVLYFCSGCRHFPSTVKQRGVGRGVGSRSPRIACL